MVWYLPGNAVVVAGNPIPDGMVYVGRGTGRWDDHDASFIDPALPIARSSTTAGTMSYWPSYKGITPEERRRYLDWHAARRRDPEADIGNVFLFFYGLERRLLLERPTPEEVRILVAEIHRLRTIYSVSGSFNGYSHRLIEAATLCNEEAAHSPQIFVPNLSADLGEMPLSLKVAIARELVAGRSLSFEYAAAALVGLPDFWSEHRQVLNKGRQAFLTVLRKRFALSFPTGYVLRSRKDSRLMLHYNGASAGLSVDLTARAGIRDLPDPATLTWSKLISLATSTAIDVAPYAKALEYHPARADSLSGLIGCPKELEASVAIEARTWLERQSSVFAVLFWELAGHAIGTTSATWTVRHRKQVSAALANVGYAMEPPPNETIERIDDTTIVQVFRCVNSAPSKALEVPFAAAVLVAAVANVSEAQWDGIAEHWLMSLPSRLALTAEEMVRLRARLAWLKGKSASLAKAKRALGEATIEDKEFCAWSATIAASAAGRISKVDVAALEAIYAGLGVPRATLYASLHEGFGAAATTADEPQLVSDEVAELVHPIPLPPVVAQAPSNADRLARLRADTARVSALLDGVFTEDEPPPQEAPPQRDHGLLTGLDAAHGRLVTHLLTRAEWPRADFDSAAADAGLMPSGAMETINEWAFDNFEDALLEDGGIVAVNRDLLPSDMSSAAAE